MIDCVGGDCVAMIVTVRNFHCVSEESREKTIIMIVTVSDSYCER